MQRTIVYENTPNVTIYSFKDADLWKKRIEQRPGDIQEKQKKLDKYAEIAHDLQKQANDLRKNKIAPIEADIKALTARINVLELPDKIKQNLESTKESEKKFDEANGELERIRQTMSVFERKLQHLHNLRKIILLSKEQATLALEIPEAEKTLKVTKKELGNVDKALSRLKLELQSQEQAVVRLTQNSYTSSVGQGSGYTSSGGHGNEYYSSGTGENTSGYTSSASNHALENLQKAIRKLKEEIVELEKKHTKLLANIPTQERVIEDKQRQNKEISNKLTLDFSYDEKNEASGTTIYQLDADIRKEEQSLLPHQQEAETHGKLLVTLQNTINAGKRNQREMEAAFKRDLVDSAAYKDNSNITDLKQKLTIKNNEKNPLDSDLNQVISYQLKNDENTTNVQREKLQLELDLQKLKNNTFLAAYWRTPMELFQGVREKVLAAVKTFNSSHPSAQSDKTRAALVDLEEKIDLIQSQVTPDETGDSYRLAFQQLCGLLFDINDNVDDPVLINSIILAVGFKDNAEYHELNHDECRLKFYDLRNRLPKLGIATAERLKEVEEKDYNAAYSRLHNIVNMLKAEDNHKVDKLIKAGNNMLAHFDKNKLAPHKPGNPFDVKFHTTILNKASDWLLDSTNPVLRDDFKTLIKTNHNGQPSLSKKIGGACMMFAGALIVAASLVGKIVSLGIAAPITFVGMGVGGTMFASGATLFGLGCQKGEQKQMQNFKKRLDECDGVDLKLKR